MPVELTPDEQEKARILALTGRCGTHIAHELHVPVLRVFPFLKKNNLYIDGRKKSQEPIDTRPIHRSLYRHEGASLDTLAKRAHFKGRECARQYLIRKKLFQRWWADRERQYAREKNVNFTRKHLDIMTEHLSILEHTLQAQQTGDSYVLEVLRKGIVINHQNGNIQYRDIDEAAGLLRAYDFYVLAHERAPPYAEISSSAPTLSRSRGEMYLARAGRELLIHRRKKRERERENNLFRTTCY